MTKQHKIIRLGIIYFAAFAIGLASTIVYLSCTHARERWMPEQAWAWHKTQPWLVGANFIPSTAINQLEMFQAETFDAATIDRELGYAEKLGFTSMRVFLHDLLWLQDSDGFLRRLDRTLALAEKHNIGLVLVLFNSCGHPLPQPGQQPAPAPGVNNSAWLQSPGVDVLRDAAKQTHLEAYVRGVVTRFKDDPRVQAWDVWNEPANLDGQQDRRPGTEMDRAEKERVITALLPKVFQWARESAPSQPLTSAPWRELQHDGSLHPLEQIQIDLSDVVSFHSSDAKPGPFAERMAFFQKFGRPVLCTEYISAAPDFFFHDPILDIMRQSDIGSFKWGFVEGKIQTQSNIFRADGSAFDYNEVIYIRSLSQMRAKQEREARLEAYLQREYAASVTEVKVEARQIRIQGRASGDVMLAGIRPEMDVSDETLDTASLDLHPLTLTKDAFTLLIPRLEESGMDRIYLKWAVVTVSGGHARLVSAAKYATDLSAASEWQYPADPIPTSKKGLQHLSSPEPNLADALELGVQHVNVNLVLSQILALEPGPNTIPFTSAGKTYYIKSGSLEYPDAVIQWAAKHNIRVTARIFIRPLANDDPLRAYLNHPDVCKPGKFAMPNLKTRSAVEHYTAVLEFLARRYSRPDKKYGRIHNWGAHNEIECAWVWTNAGRELMGSYMDDNTKSMRVIYHAARKFNPHARVFVAFAQFWNRPASDAGKPGLYSIREMLERLVLQSAVEGDFDWGIDIHPYAQNIRELRTWEDSKATHTFDTELITFKNIEVVDAYLQQPHLLYQGKHLRPVILLEGGFHCPPGDAERERVQSAAIIYAWRKIQPLKSIEVWNYYQHIDMLGEGAEHPQGALFLGLRYYNPDNIGRMGEKKHSHDIYRVLGTADEAAATAFAGSIIGIPLDSIPYRQSIH